MILVISADWQSAADLRWMVGVRRSLWQPEKWQVSDDLYAPLCIEFSRDPLCVSCIIVWPRVRSRLKFGPWIMTVSCCQIVLDSVTIYHETELALQALCALQSSRQCWTFNGELSMVSFLGWRHFSLRQKLAKACYLAHRARRSVARFPRILVIHDAYQEHKLTSDRLWTIIFWSFAIYREWSIEQPLLAHTGGYKSCCDSAAYVSPAIHPSSDRPLCHPTHPASCYPAPCAKRRAADGDLRMCRLINCPRSPYRGECKPERIKNDLLTKHDDTFSSH